MSKFRTLIASTPFSFNIRHSHPTLCLGSCFAENIGSKLKDFKFPTLINPFGILYNPFSIGNAMETLLQTQVYSNADLFESNGLWHSFDHHGQFSNPDQSVCLKNINNSLHSGKRFLQSANRIILTFGTSNVFFHKKTQKIVANCHKVPNDQFERSALTINDIVEKLRLIFNQLNVNQPTIEIILTVSPIRHIRDSLVENQRSKSRLLLACDQLCKEFDFVHYFPSYEIMMDDLRDYRFYTPDMLHPNELAIEYIWEYFNNSFFDKETISLNTKISKIIKAIKHRPFHPNSDAHQGFILKHLALIDQLKTMHDFLDFDQDRAILATQLR